MSFSDRLKDATRRLLNTYGQSVVMTRNTKSAYDATTGEVITTTTSYTVSAYTSEYDQEEINGVEVQQGDILLLVYSVEPPVLDDIASVDSVNYRVMSVRKIKGMNSVIMYKCQLRA